MMCSSTNQGREEVLVETIARLEKRSEAIRSVVYANPHQEIIDLRKKVNVEIVRQGYERSEMLIKKASLRERELLNQIRQQNRQSSSLLLELISVDMQIDDLKKELCALTLPVLLNT